MAILDDPRTFGRTRLSFADEAEIDDFVATLARFERGEIGPDQWRAYRLVRGTYGQRQADDAQMLRIKIPQGVLGCGRAPGARGRVREILAGLRPHHDAPEFPASLHAAADVEPAMRQLASAGLTTREACGNSVRNITACPYAGVAADEAFDVTPYAEALTRYLLRHPLELHAPAQVQDRLRGVRRGSRGHRHQRHRVAGPGQTCRRRADAGLPRHRRWRNVHPAEVRRRAVRVPPGGATCSTSPRRSSASTTDSATTSTSRRTA